jgi:membrane carboxypeptidase/penicillin-binding protein PbpC
MVKRRRTDKTMVKRRTDNTMAKRRRTYNTMVKRRSTDNTMVKRRRTDKTMVKRRTENTMAVVVTNLSLFMTYHRNCNKSNTIGATFEVGTDYPPGTPQFGQKKKDR